MQVDGHQRTVSNVSTFCEKTETVRKKEKEMCDREPMRERETRESERERERERKKERVTRRERKRDKETK